MTENLGVSGSTSLGSNSDDQLLVSATSLFSAPATFEEGITVGTTTLTIDSSGNLVTTGTITASGDISTSGDLSVSGNLTVGGNQTYSGGATFIVDSSDPALSVTQNGTGPITIFKKGTQTLFEIPNSGAINLSALDSSLWQVSGANLTIQTTTSGDLTITSAGNLTEIFSQSGTYQLKRGTEAILTVTSDGAVNITARGTDQNIILSPSGTGVVSIVSHLLPSTDNTYDLGSSTLRWRSLYTAGLTLTYDSGNNRFVIKTTQGGTGTLRPLQITTGSNTGLVIDTSGRVGIGTTSPGAKLEVGGKIYVTDGGPVAGNGAIEFNDNNGGAGLASIYGYNQGLALSAYSVASNAPHLFINNLSRIGIGTTTPEYKLDVTGSARFKSNGPSLIIQTTDDTQWPRLLFRNAASDLKGSVTYKANSDIFVLRKMYGEGAERAQVSLTDEDIEFKTFDGSSLVSTLFLDGSVGGYVGIGTTSPLYRLDVRKDFTDLSGTQRLIYALANAVPTSDSTATIEAMYFEASLQPSAEGNINNLYGAQGAAVNYNPNYNVTGGAYGLIGEAWADDNTYIETGYAIYPWIRVDAGATMNTAYIIKGVITNSGTINTLYGLYLPDVSAVATTSYAIYSAGGKVYFAGNVGIGTT